VPEEASAESVVRNEERSNLDFHLRLAVGATLLSFGLGAAQQRLVATDSAQVAMVWSGHPVDFSLLEKNDTLYAAYYAAEPDRQMTVARRLPSGTWVLQGLDNAVGWDSHNYITMQLDSRNRLHVSGNMHNNPLVYYRATVSGDIQSLTRVRSMVGTLENSVTYPVFIRGTEEALHFMYRDGGSGNGNQIVNAWNPTAQTWSRLISDPLFDGEGVRSAYLGSPAAGPVAGPDGFYHLFWFWRSTPDAATTHRVSYMRSRNLTQWQTAAGANLTLPLRFGTAGVIVDPIPERAGLINRGQIGFDAQGRPIITYHKFDASAQAYTQLYNARLENGAWKVYQSTDWTYRWNFGGLGSLVLEIEFGPVTLNPDGSLTQWYRHARYGSGVLVLNPTTLHADSIRPDSHWPVSLEPARRSGMQVNWLETRSSVDPTVVHALRWETMPANQDLPRNPIPAPTPLQWFRFRDPNVATTSIEIEKAAKVRPSLSPSAPRVQAKATRRDGLGRRSPQGAVQVPCKPCPAFSM
jgi:BNR repeat-containing family member